MKEYQKLLYQDMKRQQNEKARVLVKLGLFEQKEEETFDASNYDLITYGKKYRGLYDLYQNKETLEMVYVCPLIEDNKGEEGVQNTMTPYAYDCIYLELLDGEEFALVKQAAKHENTLFIDILYYAAIVLYLALLVFTIISIIAISITKTGLVNVLLICGSIISGTVLASIFLPLLIIKYRGFKAE